MRGLFLLTLALIAPVAAQARLPLPPSGPRPPPRIVSFAPPPSVVACQSGQATLVESAPFHDRLWHPWVPPVMAGTTQQSPPAPPTADTYTFSIDAEGAVIDLTRLSMPTMWPGDEQAAALATWRFAAGAPAKGCRLDLTPTTVALSEASPAKLFEIIALQGRQAPPVVSEALSKRGDCHKQPVRRPQIVVYPDLRAFDNTSIAPAWAGIQYGIDANGAVRDVTIVARHGEAAFADTAAASVTESRFLSGSPRTACYAVFSASTRATPARPRPELKAYKRPGDTCEVTREALNIPEAKMYPPAYAARKVPGWAILRFDVAPWGAVGNIEVLASQPSDAFGAAARNLVANARPNPPASGYRGCLVPVIYAIPDAVEGDS